MGSIKDEKGGNIRQRLWGAAVFIAIMVIVLPLLLDGAGSESQFRRVEKLRPTEHRGYRRQPAGSDHTHHEFRGIRWHADQECE